MQMRSLRSAASPPASAGWYGFARWLRRSFGYNPPRFKASSPANCL